MPTMEVFDANGVKKTIEMPPAAGRAAAAASRSMALSTEDKAVIDAQAASLVSVVNALNTLAGYVDGLEGLLTALGNYTDGLEGLLTALGGNTDGIEGLLGTLNSWGTQYEVVAADQVDTVLGAGGAVGDLVSSILIIPATTSPGAVSIKDGSGGTAIPVFAGGATSLSNIAPFAVPLGLKATGAGWRITTGSNVSVIACGNFT